MRELRRTEHTRQQDFEKLVLRFATLQNQDSLAFEFLQPEFQRPENQSNLEARFLQPEFQRHAKTKAIWRMCVGPNEGTRYPVSYLFQIRHDTQFTIDNLVFAHNRALKRYLIRLRTGANVILQRTRKLLVFLPMVRFARTLENCLCFFRSMILRPDFLIKR